MVSNMVKLIVNVEVGYGLSIPEEYIDEICNKLEVDADNKHLVNQYNDSYYWIVDDVDVNKYNDGIDNIQKYVMSLYTKGLIQYFYIGTL